MSIPRSFISIEDIKTPDISSIFSTAKEFKKAFEKQGSLPGQVKTQNQLVMTEAFFEASTRTRLSFQMAAQRLGLRVVGMDLQMGSSLLKGESVVETIANMAAMKPDLLVVRAKDHLEDVLRALPCAVINAGTGVSGHPTQALLDAFTLKEQFTDLKGLRLLIVGDIRHSRVANSNVQLMKKLEVEVRVAAPLAWRPTGPLWENISFFDDLSAGLSWCDACMGLRIQRERHDEKNAGITTEDYIRSFRLDRARVHSLAEHAVILHPGPFVDGVDFEKELLDDPRCLVHQQVTNGVFVRASLMALMLGLVDNDT